MTAPAVADTSELRMDCCVGWAASALVWVSMRFTDMDVFVALAAESLEPDRIDNADTDQNSCFLGGRLNLGTQVRGGSGSRDYVFLD